MKEAHFVSILAYPRLDACTQALVNQDKQLTIAFSLKGENATDFCKDLSGELQNWQITSPEQLHQQILDLLSFTRTKNLELEFALSLLTGEKVIFATYSGMIILKRNGQVRKILASDKEIKIIVGNFKDNDQIILANQASLPIEAELSTMLESEISLEKLISEMSIIAQQNNNLGESLAFLTYKDKVSELPTSPVTRTFRFKKAWQKIKIFSQKIQQLIKKIVTWLQNQDRQKLTRGALLMTAIVVILIISIIIGQRQKQKTITNINSKIANITENISNINQLVLEQPLLARESAQKSLNELDVLKKEKNNSDSLKLIEAQITKLQNLIAEISGNNSLDKLSVAYNLDNFLAKKIEVQNGEIFLLENNDREILRIKKDQSQEKISLTGEGKIRAFSISENKLFILSTGIKMLDLSKNEQAFTDVKAEGESDKNGELLSSFGPYLYLLNRDKRNIYRYYYKDDQLSDPIGWLVDKQGINFDNISDLMVDGDLWLGTKNGDLLKFAKGSRTDLQIKGLTQMPNSPLILSSNEAIGFVAILEKQNKRLLILTKDGQLISEIKSNELSGANSIAFDDDGKRIYVLSGSVIYSIEMLK